MYQREKAIVFRILWIYTFERDGVKLYFCTSILMMCGVIYPSGMYGIRSMEQGFSDVEMHIK